LSEQLEQGAILMQDKGVKLSRVFVDLGYRGDYRFEVFTDDYQQFPPKQVAWRARRVADWLAEAVLRRGTPLRNEMRLLRLVRRRDLPAVST
jgi:hypothetical protein